ncbi:GFA family protein [Caulobacter henricii]|uniref:Aldehyde-activating protein n=1 Tax=Caulobacter henricii TaxID=69395 RepID=A0A0P0NZW9_9CAUL|nr:GFA family protein [Caulobacter henricii]ALL13408.1 aldehyde-activating protein [Caulobacter henricii]
MVRHQGGCQCGRVRFEVEVELQDLISCNCSRCGRLGSVLAFAAEDDFKLLQGQDALTEYRFNTGKIAHLFCSECGIESFGRGEGPGGVRMAAINVRCLDEVDVFALEPVQVNGKAF